MVALSESLFSLTSADELLRTLLNVALHGVVLFRPVYALDGSGEIIDFAYEYLNPAAQQILQQPERPAKSLLTLYPNATHTGIFAFCRGVFLSGEPGRYNVNYQHDELDNYFLLVAQRSGQLLVVSFTDTADHERSVVEMALRESQAREQAAHAEAERQRQQLERFFMLAPAAICVYSGPKAVYELVNPAYQRLFPGRVLLGKPLLEALPELANQPAYRALRQVYTSGGMYKAHAVHVSLAVSDDGPLEDHYFDFIYQARYDEQGCVDGVLVFAFEVMDQILFRHQVQELNEELAVMNEELQVTNEELNSTNQQLTRTNIDLDNFIYTASHDLKAPIMNIEGLLSLLQTELPAAVQASEVGEVMALMQDSINRFRRTIEHLTDVSRLQKEHSQQVSLVKLAEVIEGVRLDLQPLISQTEAQLEVAVAQCPLISFSEKNLRSVVYNLLSNALKYRHPERVPHVYIRCRVVGDYHVLEVQDNGLGIDLARSRQLFGMFQRYHTHVEGSGVGLYMIKKMVENAGGQIQIESQLNTGSTFTVYFRR